MADSHEVMNSLELPDGTHPRHFSLSGEPACWKEATKLLDNNSIVLEPNTMKLDLRCISHHIARYVYLESCKALVAVDSIAFSSSQVI